VARAQDELSAERAPIAALVLAAGTSTRLGEPKQLLDLDGRPLVQHVVDAAAAAGLRPIVVVLGHAAGEVAAALDLPPGARTVVNRRYADGQSTSLRAGLDAMAEEVVAAVAVLLADQPTLPAATIRAVVTRHGESATPVTRPRFDGTPGPPVILDRSVWDVGAAAAPGRGGAPRRPPRPR
jgi:molybdenum cofactor cytidylyltransferase